MPHIHEKIDFTAEVYVVNNNKVLLRKHDKYNLWLSIGGHVELDEDPIEAALREVKEEVGLEVEIIPTTKLLETNTEMYKHLIAPAFMNRHTVKDGHEHVTLIYFAKTNESKIQQGNKEISDGCEWFSIDDLDKLDNNINDTIKEYAKTALKFIENE